MPGKSNRIEVDLQLMQAEAIDKLEKFSRDFDNSLDRLAKLLDNSALGKGTPPTGPAGQLGPDASTSSQTDQQMQGVGTARLGGQPPAPGNIGYDSNGGGPSTPETVEDQFIRVQRRVMGNEVAIPTTLRQALGYAAEGQLNLNPFQPLEEYGDKVAKIRANPNLSEADKTKKIRQERFGTANDVMFNYESTKALGMNAMHKYTNFFGGLQSIQSVGYNTQPDGSRHGLFGTPLFSGSFLHGLNESVWQPLVSSTFGLNPNYSMGQAQQARQAINSYGWSSGNMGNWLANVLKENTIKNGIDPMTQMAILDPSLRWGGNSFQQLNATLQQIPSAAAAAGYTLQQFTEQLVQTSQQAAMQTGIPVGTVMQGISTLSATTGLPPSQLGEMYNMKSVLMASGTTGKKPWDIMFGPNQQAVLARPLSVFQSVLGMPIKQWQKGFYKSRPGSKLNELAKQRMMYADFLYQSDPQIFGGMAPFQAAHILGQAGSIGGLMRQGNLQNEIHGLSDSNQGALDSHIESILGHYYRGNPSRDRAMVQDYIKQAGDRTASERKELAERLIRGYQPHDRRNQAKMMLGLTPDAKKLVSLMGSDPSHSNSSGFFGRLSSLGGWESVGSDALNIGAGFMGF